MDPVCRSGSTLGLLALDGQPIVIQEYGHGPACILAR
jgi:hypothetical protein